ncbi:MAG: M48 family metallopeptidase [Xenococcaceae cyanobacterium MO_188.B29]|nr:M48 family metallopeptidase [Xenococcaceae cyanobacterium MO_188.B29]
MSYHSPSNPKNAPPSNRQFLLVIGMFLGAIAVFFWLFKLLLNGIIMIIPLEVEQQLGTVIVPTYEQQAKPSPQQNTLNQLLDRLEANLPSPQHSQRDYQVLYIPESTVNALALPGDKIVIYQGLIEKVKSENELMMVLGHELGHFAHRDHLRGLGNALLIRVSLGFFLGDLGIFQIPVGNSIEAIANAQYSQSQEKQADAFGLTLLNKTYGHVAGATDFFTRLSQEENNSLSFFSSHPASQQRIKKLEQLIKENNYPILDRSSLPKVLTNVSKNN